MIGRPGRSVRAAFALAAAFAVCSALLGGFLWSGVDRLDAAQRRAAELEGALAQAQGEVEAVRGENERLAREAQELRAGEEERKKLESEIALNREEMHSLEGELQRRASLCEAQEERSGALAEENRSLRQTVERLDAQAKRDRAQIEELGALLTTAEEELAGKEAIYKEAAAQLESMRGRLESSEAQAAALGQRLTEVEEEYAGASALLAESEQEMQRVYRTALSYYISARNLRYAGGAPEPEQTAAP